MPDQPETPGQQMSRLIREAPGVTGRQRMLAAIRANWAKTTATTTEEKNRG